MHFAGLVVLANLIVCCSCLPQCSHMPASFSMHQCKMILIREKGGSGGFGMGWMELNVKDVMQRRRNLMTQPQQSKLLLVFNP